MIDGYLKNETELDDRAIHLLFSANRWELWCVSNSSRGGGSLLVADNVLPQRRDPQAAQEGRHDHLRPLCVLGRRLLCQQGAFQSSGDAASSLTIPS